MPHVTLQVSNHSAAQYDIIIIILHYIHMNWTLYCIIDRCRKLGKLTNMFSAFSFHTPCNCRCIFFPHGTTGKSFEQLQSSWPMVRSMKFFFYYLLLCYFATLIHCIFNVAVQYGLNKLFLILIFSHCHQLELLW